MNLFKTTFAVATLLVSFSITSYLISWHVASVQEQVQDDFINDNVGDKVVEIRDPEGKRGGGTGFFVSTPRGNSFILTNNHVCGLAENNQVMIDGEYFAQVIAHSPDHDLCIISNPLDVEGISLGASSRDGQDIYIVGHPLLEPRAAVKGQISGTMEVDIAIGYNIPCSGKNLREIIADPNSLAALFGIRSICIRAYEAQAVTANILPGNSGSPVVDHDGKLVGVAFAGRDDGPGRGYIIPLQYIQKFLADK